MATVSGCLRSTTGCGRSGMHHSWALTFPETSAIWHVTFPTIVLHRSTCHAFSSQGIAAVSPKEAHPLY